jgi:hypothetical protein
MKDTFGSKIPGLLDNLSKDAIEIADKSYKFRGLLAGGQYALEGVFPSRSSIYVLGKYYLTN